MIYVSGPGHGGPAVVGNTYLEGTYTRSIRTSARMRPAAQALSSVSFPAESQPRLAGVPRFDPRGRRAGILAEPLVRRGVRQPRSHRRVRGGRWRGGNRAAGHGVAFQQVSGPGHGRRRAAHPASQRLQDFQPDRAGAHHARGIGTVAPRLRVDALLVEGHEPAPMHEAMAATLDTAIEQIKAIQRDARVNGNIGRPRWPMIVLNSPKGWTGPKIVDGLQVEGTFRAHQVPLSDPATHPEHLKLLEDWLRSYRPEELFDERGRLKPELAELAPKGERRMGANPHANGGMLLRDLRMPDFRDYAEPVPAPGVGGIGDTHVLGRFLRDVEKLNAEQRNFRVFGPDETLSNGLKRFSKRRNANGTRPPCQRRISGARRARDGNAQRAPMRGLAGGLLTHRPPWTFQLLRGVHPHCRFHVQPACQVAEVTLGCPGGARSPR